MIAEPRRLPLVTIAICLTIMAAIAAGLVNFWPTLLVLFEPGRIARTYYIPSQSMRPTLNVNDKIRPLQLTSASLRRGTVVTFNGAQEVRVDRVAAVGGDTIALRDGIVILNGQPVPQRVVGAGPVIDNTTPTRILIERFPGEDHWHRILDAGPSEFDDMPATPVAPGTIFVLGDNRDMAADSRVPTDEYGVGEVPMKEVIGIADTLMWSHDRWRIGRPIDDPTANRIAPR